LIIDFAVRDENSRNAGPEYRCCRAGASMSYNTTCELKKPGMWDIVDCVYSLIVRQGTGRKIKSLNDSSTPRKYQCLENDVEKTFG
jgi:hypothetical protein